MSDKSYEALSKEFMELWQKQWAAVMGDKRTMDAMLAMFQTMQQGPYANAAPRDSHPAPASAHHEQVDELVARLAQCERRIAKLESDAKKPARKRKSTRI